MTDNERERVHALVLGWFKRLGVSDGEPGHIMHDHLGKFVKSPLSLEGELEFGFLALMEMIGEMALELHDLRLQVLELQHKESSDE